MQYHYSFTPNIASSIRAERELFYFIEHWIIAESLGDCEMILVFESVVTRRCEHLFKLNA